jgi:VWFA-related protein
MRFLAFLLAGLLCAQQTPAPDPVIRMNVNLIQVDVTVTDNAGRHVAGLGPEDFEVFQNGKRQKLTSAIWVPANPAPSTTSAAPGTGPRARRQLDLKEVKRLVTVVVDDISLSFEGLNSTKTALRKFIETGMQPGDAVAIVAASKGAGALQPFTSDRAQLLRIVDKMRLYLLGRDSVSAVKRIEVSEAENSTDAALAEMAMQDRLQDEIIQRQIADVSAAGMLGAARTLIQGLSELPGRKSMLLFSESVQLYDMPQTMTNPLMNPNMRMNPGAQGGTRDRTVAGVNELVRQANRSGVVLYTIDPRGLVDLGRSVMDRMPANQQQAQGMMDQRTFNFNLSRDGMKLLAEETGGLFFGNTNDIAGAMQEALRDQEGYYLIGFQPDDQTFELSKAGPKTHRLQVKVKRRGLDVRYRRSFAGVSEDASAPKPVSPLISAIESPFRRSEIPIQLTPLFGYNKKAGLVLNVLLHVDAAPLRFSPQAADPADKNQEPWSVAEIQVQNVLFDEAGQMVESATRSHKIQARGKTLEAIRRDGLHQQIEFPVRRPGNYQMRMAVMDSATQNTGSAGEFVELPDMATKRLALSGIALASEAYLKNQTATGAPSRRLLESGEKLNYGALLYNALFDPQTKASRLEMQLALYRDGKRVYLGKKNVLQTAGKDDVESLTISGTMDLGPTLPAGGYVLELAVRDLLAPPKRQFAVRTMDFEVRPKP